ncbi:protein indeterminate-domain 14-like [Gossypium australe]|uniref:Protein indeterminate-domain 14-like n=1 Tax=Gossypium australe TaxID=47621 RepID=A0A5B6U4E7_9ROSI|nr:protein indeterminate-domain 14-like [Gossypium australe]
MEEEDQRGQPLPPLPIAATVSSSSLRNHSTVTDQYYEGPSLDLQLSINLRPIQKPSDSVKTGGAICDVKSDSSSIESLRWQAGEQIRLAAIETAYAERVRELAKMEMEMAQSEFARARHMWLRAREEVEKAEKMKQRATRQIDSKCIEISCQSCRQRFRP